MHYQAIVVGGSFAGLAVASQLRGRVLLVEPKPIGTGQTSACATFTAVIEAIGATDSILQTHDRLSMHFEHGSVAYRLRHAFSTFDYRRFCQALLEGVQGDVVRARAIGLDGTRLLTDQGAFEADCLVDASGWQAVVASALDATHVNRADLRFGLETEIADGGDGLGLWPGKDVARDGYGWVFPCGDFRRVGVYGRLGDDARQQLSRFLGRLGLEPSRELHGGFAPARLRPPTVGHVFAVGDAAGQCFAASGEGIRLALYFGQACGQIVQQIVEGRLSLEGGLMAYRRFVARHRRYFGAMRLWESAFRLPDGVALALARLASLRPLLRFMEGEYWRAARPDRLHQRVIERRS